MKDQDQIKAIAELDGWEYTLCKGVDCENGDRPWQGMLWCRNGQRVETLCLPDYLTSRDAIVPVIENQYATWSGNKRHEFFVSIGAGGRSLMHQNYQRVLFATPRQLCESLLRATGKWKDLI